MHGIAYQYSLESIVYPNNLEDMIMLPKLLSLIPEINFHKYWNTGDFLRDENVNNWLECFSNLDGLLTNT